MNCKQGDLAIVLPGIHPRHEHKVGTIVKCVHFMPAPEYNNEAAWIVDPPLGKNFEDGYRRIRGDWLLDKRLKPIRDPGDDAQDETLQWKTVPVGGLLEIANELKRKEKA